MTTDSAGGCCKREDGDTLLFVYGTLKRNEINFPFWMLNSPHNVDTAAEFSEAVQFVGVAKTVSRYPLFVNSTTHLNCSPCLLDRENYPGAHRVHGEVFLVSAQRRAELDELEGVSSGVYTPREIDVEVKHASAPHRITAERAMVYFRSRKFDEDWETRLIGTPHVLKSFSAVDRLVDANRTDRLYDCLPAHRRFATLTPPCDPLPMVLVILDGIGDAQCAALNGKTPLGFAQEVNTSLSVVTRSGLSGLLDSFEAGTACGSDTAHLSLLGYDPRLYYRGRGAFESLGAGMSMTAEEDIAFKCNFSVMDMQTRRVTHRRCDRDFTLEGPILCAALDGATVTHDCDGGVLEHGPHTVRVKYATEHRCGVVITGGHLSDAISGTDPLSDGLPLMLCVPTASREQDAVEHEKAVYTCRVVTAASKALSDVLVLHPVNVERIAAGKNPANIVLLRGAAKRNAVPDFERRHGLRGFMVAPTCIIRGLGLCCGLDVVDSEGGTGDYHSNLLNKAVAVVEGFKQRDPSSGRRRYQFAVLHVKGTDDAGHDGLPMLKAEMLAKAGTALQYLWDHLGSGATIAVTGDHSTLCSMEDHSTEPVPFSIACVGGAVKRHWPRDATSVFEEAHCAVFGSLGRFQGCHLIPVMKAFHYDVPMTIEASSVDASGCLQDGMQWL